MKDISILIVEDDAAIARVLSDRLAREGYAVLKAIDGVEGLDMALKEHPTLILMDIIMPRMDGLTALKKLRDDKWGKNADVMMLTNLGQEEDIELGKQLGAKDYLIKSDMKMADIVERIKDKVSTIT